MTGPALSDAAGPRSPPAAPFNRTPPSLLGGSLRYHRQVRPDALGQELVAFGVEVELVGDEQLRSGPPVGGEADVVAVDVARVGRVQCDLADLLVERAVLVVLPPPRRGRAHGNVDDL